MNSIDILRNLRSDMITDITQIIILK